jgi:hypothetical protein
MSVELRPCGLQGWAVCEGNCEECGNPQGTNSHSFNLSFLFTINHKCDIFQIEVQKWKN